MITNETKISRVYADGLESGHAIFPPPDDWSGESLIELEAAVVVSLFTDRRIEPQELLSGDEDRRGWWGDSFPETVGDGWGSRLWLGDRALLVDGTPERLRQYVEDALAWLVQDGVATEVVADVRREGSAISLGVEIRRGRSEDPDVLRYAYAWEV
ncbi:MAG: phage GP46 family protein [Gemmatimonadales bacterium]|jgi:phage gp46-like protein